MLETVTYTQAIPPHVGGSGAVFTGDSEREREEEEDKGKGTSPQRRVGGSRRLRDSASCGEA